MNNGPYSTQQRNSEYRQNQALANKQFATNINVTNLEYQGILYAINHKAYTIAKNLIQEFADPTYALKIFEAIKKTPVYILAFLKNPNLADALMHRDLQELIIRVQKQLSTLKESKKSIVGLDQISVAIVKNPVLCRVLGYRFYLNFLQNDEVLANHIIHSREFIVNLNYTHIDRHLINVLPNSAAQILSTLNSILNSKDNHYKWVINTLKWLFVKNAIAQNLILNNLHFIDIHNELLEEFYNDRFFAIEVIKAPHLYTFIGVDQNSAYAHPLLKMKDYYDLAEHFRNSHPSLAEKYQDLEFLTANDSLTYSSRREVNNSNNSKITLIDQLSDTLQKLNFTDSTSTSEKSNTPLLFISENVQINKATQASIDKGILQKHERKSTI